MALTITSSSYAGRHAGLYVNAALKTAASLEYMTVRENVNYKEVINKISGADLVKDATCAFNEQSAALTMTEQVLQVEPFQINLDVCKREMSATMLQDWSGENPDDFVAFCMTYLADSIADSVEYSIWQGGTGTSGQFNGVATGSMTASSASGTYTAANIIANLGTIATDIPTAVYGKDDTYIYMNKKTYRLYIQAISALSAFPFNHMGQYTPEFEGIKIAVCDGLADNAMYAGEKSNFFFGTSLNSDLSEVKVLDLENITGGNAVRLVAKWTAGVQVGVPADFVKQS